MQMLKFLVVACALTPPSSDLLAAQVFKCVVDGKTVYQDVPCRSKGSSLDINADVTPEQHQEAVQRASKEHQQSSASKHSSHKPSHNTPTTKEAADPDAAATQKAIADCESQRGVHCRDPETIAEHKWKNTPMTPEQQQAAARAREERRKEEELRRIFR
jgi:hypothetical protein